MDKACLHDQRCKATSLKKSMISLKWIDESVPEMFYRINVVVIELRELRKKVDDEDFSPKFLKSLPKKFNIIVTMILRVGLKDLTSTQALGEIITHDSLEFLGLSLVLTLLSSVFPL